MNETHAVGSYHVRWGAATDQGLVRSENEDAMLARPPVFLVADGMGGHERGMEASSKVIDAFSAVAAASEWLTLEGVNKAVVRAFELVAALREHAQDAPGSTLCGVGLSQHVGRPCWLIFNVGDSRTYRLRGAQLEQITVDHSEAQQLLDQGASLEEVRSHVSAHVITRAIGGGLETVPAVDQWLLPAAAEDRMLVCSDGLTNELRDDEICAILRASADAGTAASALVDAALRAGGRDNVTCVVVDALWIAGAADRDRVDEVTRPDLTVFAERDQVNPVGATGPSPASWE